jgi:hypothetical protein
MKTPLTDLREYRLGNDEDLLALGFELWEEPTTDSVRWIHFSTKLRRSAESYIGGNLGLFPDNPEHAIRICVRYTLAIADCPSGCASDNHDYCFEGASLEVVNMDSNDPVAAFPTNITTMPHLKQLLGTFRAV